jgi:hypothetical protein
LEADGDRARVVAQHWSVAEAILSSCGQYLCDLSQGVCYKSCTSDAQCKIGCNPAGKCK